MMSEQQEIELGRSSDAEVRKQYKVYANPALQSYVNRAEQKVAAHSLRPNIHYTQYHHRPEGRYLRQTGATLAVR
jgi:predicted Zn-dependent protease